MNKTNTASIQQKRYVPSEYSLFQADENLNYFIYAQTSETGVCYALAYSGRKTKSDFHYRFKSKSEMEGYIAKYVESLQKTADFKAELREQRKSFVNDFKEGDILHHSWGYDQTNCEFYQVIASKGKTVTLRRICAEVSSEVSCMSANLMPCPNVFTDEPEFKARVNSYGAKLHFGSARKWDGKPKYSSWYA